MNLEDFAKLPLMLQWATMAGVVIVIVYLGIQKFRKEPSDNQHSEYYKMDPLQYIMTSLERVERDMHGRFDRVERGLTDINRDTIEIRRARD